MPGRFFLGVGTGENLNEHILGDRWPAPDERLEMLEEAIELMRELWQGEKTTFRGKHYTVEGARIYTLPDEPPPIAVAAAAPKAAELAGRVGDAFVGVAPDSDLIGKFEQGGGEGKPRYGQLTVCWAEDEKRRSRPPTSGGRMSGWRAISPRSCRSPSTSSRRRQPYARRTSPRPSL